ncbi:hypothetical protein B5F34_16305 [Mediterranea sp. An20]|uniref:hypothetical protein n=1 Tax=Mediterranea sp. An20 TaxID=1965586 RepID=UPI000B39FB51|nr:hypothetical protein [Mediterranea sp. An20]OUP05693.1 hypothetical protein B5F34_16305 [Mediterranea sp. An20]
MKDSIFLSYFGEKGLTLRGLSAVREQICLNSLAGVVAQPLPVPLPGAWQEVAKGLEANFL